MVRFIVHGGYGKTGTSFLQQKVFSNLSDVLYLGKTDENRMVNNEIHRMVYAVFPSLINVKEKNQLRACNSSLIIPLLGDELLKLIKQSSKNIVILSNECIIEYGGYNGELNRYLLKKLFDYMQGNYDDSFDFKVIMTIRNQRDILKSFYAYQYSYDLRDYVNSFEDFIHYGLRNRHKIVFGGYHYDLVLEDLKDLFGANNVKFFLYERMEEDCQAYVNEILGFVGIGPVLDDIGFSDRVNATRENGVNVIRDDAKYPSLILLSMRFVDPFKQYIKSIPSYQWWKKSLDHRYRKKSIVEEYSSYEHDIEEMYAMSNSRLASIMNIDLSKYGYICDRRFKETVYSQET